jgi:hypothetical protein
MPLRIALLTPAPLDSPRGNAVTAASIARGGAALVAYHHPAAP